MVAFHTTQHRRVLRRVERQRRLAELGEAATDTTSGMPSLVPGTSAAGPSPRNASGSQFDFDGNSGGFIRAMSRPETPPAQDSNDGDANAAPGGYDFAEDTSGAPWPKMGGEWAFQNSSQTRVAPSQPLPNNWTIGEPRRFQQGLDASQGAWPQRASARDNSEPDWLQQQGDSDVPMGSTPGRNPWAGSGMAATPMATSTPPGWTMEDSPVVPPPPVSRDGSDSIRTAPGEGVSFVMGGDRGGDAGGGGGFAQLTTQQRIAQELSKKGNAPATPLAETVRPFGIVRPFGSGQQHHSIEMAWMFVHLRRHVCQQLRDCGARNFV